LQEVRKKAVKKTIKKIVKSQKII